MSDITALPTAYDELANVELQVTFSVPNGAGGLRPPTLAEINTLEMSLSLSGGDYITAWVFSAGTWAAGAEVLKNVDVKNTGRGAYAEATGTLTLTLYAGDMPCVAIGTVPDAVEIHELLVTGRYNSNFGQFHARATLRVRNLDKVPRVP